MTSIKGSGTVLKKCSCPSKTRCPHGWTLRYWADGKQRERTFSDTPGKPGSGKGLAEDFALKLSVGKREGDITFADKTKGAVPFIEYAGQWIDRHKNAGTVATLRTTLKRLRGELGSRTLAQVANDRELAQRLIDDAPPSYAKKTRLVIVSPVNEAVKAGRIPSHRLRGLDVDEENQRAEFTWADRDQLERLATELSELGLLVWLGRLAGLRIGESMGVNIADFRENGTVLRLSRQRLANGKLAPLKARKADDFRDIPVSPALWAYVQAAPRDEQGYLFPAITRCPIHKRVRLARDAAGLPGKFTPHWLRHMFASALLAGGIPITDVAKYLGHANIAITYRVYGHLEPAAFGRARAVLDNL
jgi:integrase